MDTFARPAAEIYVEIFAALQEPLRLRILTLIASALEEPEGEYACTSLEAKLPVTKSTISYHVKILRKAGLISVRKEGRYYRYTAREEVLEHFLPGMLDVLLDEYDDEEATVATGTRPRSVRAAR